MPIDPNIALNVRPIEQPNMLAQMGQMMALRGAQQEYEGTNALRDAYAKGGDLNDPEFRRRVMSANPKLGSQLISQHSETSARDIKTQADSLKTIKDNIGLANTPQAMAEYLRGAYGTPGGALLAKLVPLDKALANIPNDPKAFADFQRNFSLTADKLFVSAADLLQAQVSREGHGVTARGQDLLEARERERMNYDQKYPTMNQVITAQGVGVTPSRGPNVGQITPVYEPGAAPPPAAAPAATTIFSSVGGGPLGSGTYGVPNALAQGAPSNMLRPNAQAPAAAGAAPVRAQPVPSAPTLTEVANPDNPMETMRVNAREYKGGGPNSPGVLGIVKTGTLNPAQQLKVKTEMAKDFKAVDKTIAETNELLKAIDAVRNSDLERVAGPIDARTFTMTDEAKMAETRFESLKGKVTAIAKAASTMTGAIGSIANQEWQILANQIAVLDLKQGKNANLEQIEQLERQAMSIANRMRSGFERQYGEYVDTLGPQYREIPDVTYKMGSEGFTPKGQKRPAKSSATPASTGNITTDPTIDALLNKYK